MAMSDKELLGILEQEAGQCDGAGPGNQLSDERKKAYDYFNGEPFGSEVKGRSSVVSTEVADTILWILPSLMRIFTAGDEVVEFEPNSPEDEDIAKQASDYINWIFTRQNQGALIIYQLFFDALLLKNGFGKAWWEVEEVTDREERLVAPPAAEAMIAALVQQGFKITKADTELDEYGRIRIEAERTREEGQCRICNVPPEEVLISKRARDMATAPFVAHQTLRTLSSLIEDGYPREKVEQIPTDEVTDPSGDEAARRNDLDPARSDGQPVDKSMREYKVTEAYILVDYDEDGIAERRKVLYGGKVVLENEPWEGPLPIFGCTAIMLPHRVYGRSVADLVMDLQLIKSTIWRQILDNLYLSNNPRHVISDQINHDDLLTVRPGGLVRLKTGAVPAQGHVLPLEVPFVAGQSFPMLEYIDMVRENRTGVTRYNQGLQADTLNKTATGISQIMSAAQQRLELMARMLAETGIKDLFRLLLFIVTKNQDWVQKVKLRAGWVEIDPTQWRTLANVRIDVALGTGNRDQTAMHVMNLMRVQEQIAMAQQGMGGPIVTWAEVSHAARKLAENSGFKNADAWFKPVTPEQVAQQAQMAAQQPPPPSPEQQKAQGEAEKAQMQMHLKQMDAQLQAMIDQAKTQSDIENERAKVASQIEMDRAKAQSDMQVKQMMAMMQGRVKAMQAMMAPRRANGAA